MTESPTATLSQETQQLLNAGRDVLSGNDARISDLQSAIGARHTSITAGRAAFVEAVEKQGPAFREHYKPVVEAVEKQFSDYLELLDELQAGCHEVNKESLEENLSRLIEVAESAQAAMTAYEQALLTSGKSRFPEVNLVINLTTALEEGRGSVDAFRDTCLQYIKLYQGVADELAARTEPLPPGMAERKDAALSLVEAWKLCAALDLSSSAADVGAAIDALSRGHLELETSVHTFLSKSFAEGPTGSKEANWIIHSTEGFLEKRYPAIIFRTFVVDMLFRTRRALPDLEAASAQPQDDAALKELLTAAFTCTQGVEDSLARLDAQAALETPSAEELDTILSDFEIAIAKLLAANDKLKVYVEDQSKVSCPYCQARNAKGAKSCQKCQRTLPQMIDDSAAQGKGILEGGVPVPEGPVITRSLKELSDIIDAVQNKRAPMTVLTERFDLLDRQVAKVENEIPKHHLPSVPENATREEREQAEEFIELGSETQSLLVKGAELCRAGLDMMRSGAGQDDFAKVYRGYEEYFNGVQDMIKAGYLGESFNRIVGNQVKEYLDDQATRASEKENEPEPAEAPADDDSRGLV